MYTRLAISLAILFATIGCPHRASVPRAEQSARAPVDLTSAADSELQKHLGERVTMQGQFSLRGKVGPFILVGRPI